jgi:hypothetical protein
MADEFDGIGGSYIADPKTGIRTLVSRTADAVAEPVIAPSDVQTEPNDTAAAAAPSE